MCSKYLQLHLILHRLVVVLNNFENIRDAFVSQGVQFSGRPSKGDPRAEAANPYHPILGKLGDVELFVLELVVSTVECSMHISHIWFETGYCNQARKTVSNMIHLCMIGIWCHFNHRTSVESQANALIIISQCKQRHIFCVEYYDK